LQWKKKFVLNSQDHEVSVFISVIKYAYRQ
jgi:hypothetical protein